MQYQHGGDIYRTPIQYDFSISVNPLGMPKPSLQAAREALHLCHCYPDYQGEKLRLALSEVESLPPEWILLGNGAAELIYALCHAMRPKNALLTAPAFQEYEAAIGSAGGSSVFWNLKESENFCLKEDFLSAITKENDLLFICNPNNPTGSIMEWELLIQIAEKCKKTNTILCIDECFLPFMPKEKEAELTMKKALCDFPQLIVLRAFTKIYAMAGLRLGYVLSANERLLEQIRQCIQPWNTSLPAQRAGEAALGCADYLKQTRLLLKQEKEYLLREIQDGLAEKIYPPGANFIFFKSRKDLKEKLLRKKILIRDCGNFHGLSKGYFRIGIRSHEENFRLISSWREIMDRERLVSFPVNYSGSGI